MEFMFLQFRFLEGIPDDLSSLLEIYLILVLSGNVILLSWIYLMFLVDSLALILFAITILIHFPRETARTTWYFSCDLSCSRYC